MSRTALDARLSPAWRAVLLASATSAATVIAAVVLSLAAPQLDTLTARLIVVIALAVAAVIVVATSRHRDLLWSGGVSVPLLIVPTLIVLAPFAGGLKDLGAQTTLILVVGYIATGVFEEFWFRGVILRTLRTWTPLRAALFSSALFGLAHLSNLVFGANLWVTIAQVVGAACYGVGFAALRLRGTSDHDPPSPRDHRHCAPARRRLKRVAMGDHDRRRHSAPDLRSDHSPKGTEERPAGGPACSPRDGKCEAVS